MTIKELHSILDVKDRNISLDELEDIIFQLKCDCSDKYSDCVFGHDFRTAEYYAGEENAFYICLCLLDHLNVR